MTPQPLSMDDSYSEVDAPERISPNGQMIGIAVYGGLVLVGFAFGIVTGYDSPKPPIVVAKHDKEKDKDTPKPDSAKPDASKPVPPKSTTPISTPPQELNPTPPRADPPKVDPPKNDPPVIVMPPKKDPPKVDPPKTDPPPPPKKEEPVAVVKPVSFEKDVKPILRSYCFNCHGAAGKPKGDVDLTSLAKIVDPKNPPILKAGDPKKSSIYTQIADQAMPPNGSRPGKGETEVIRNWILAGAKPRRRKLRDQIA
jgi:periplasmic protein TonB